MGAGSRILDDPDEVLSDVVSLCAKVWNDNESLGKIHVTDLIELRDRINDIRGHIAQGGGYKTLPRLIKPKDSQ
jgi:hypothetical protein